MTGPFQTMPLNVEDQYAARMQPLQQFVIGSFQWRVWVMQTCFRPLAVFGSF
jgi:hypothetical protein